MSLQLNDPKMLEAIGILANVLDDITGPERLECLMAANALRQVVETKSESALTFAQQAFESLEPDVRRRIHTDATETAIKVMERANRRTNPRLSRPAGKPSGGGILDALNTGGLKTERKW
ncbi:hypothetical protein HHL28_01355 [Aerophototrophica crusticola]|uniref:Uncharacterized protein n=1 Tax=Aerophototrophica crusticola TaxID=1709002 RepID=A0A858R3I2_9PROT|nr:hypothetical protein HHL28_01355 [Rhodospirillaceae bacterium B3]